MSWGSGDKICLGPTGRDPTSHSKRNKNGVSKKKILGCHNHHPMQGVKYHLEDLEVGRIVTPTQRELCMGKVTPWYDIVYHVCFMNF